MEDIKYKFEEQFPRSVINVADWRANMRGLFQGDVAALRPSAKRILDEMEYSTDGAAAAEYSGTGVTITKQSVSGSLVQEGSFSLKSVTDGTSNRSFSRSFVADLSAFAKILLWERSSAAGDTFQFYLEDGSGNKSYWDITADAGGGIYQQDELDLTAPDADSGSPADLEDIVAYGFRELTASTTYYFDTIKLIVGLGVAVQGTSQGGYFRHVTFQRQPLEIGNQGSPLISVPITNPRIDILTIDSSGTLAWVQGAENASPVAPWDSVPIDVVPICEVYLKTTMDKVLDFDDRATDTDQGYIQADVRPFIVIPEIKGKGADVASAGTMTLGDDGRFFFITGTTTITSITIKAAGTIVVLKFNGVVTVTDGSNLKLAGNFVTAAGSVLTLISDGTDWWEMGRVNT